MTNDEKVEKKATSVRQKEVKVAEPKGDVHDGGGGAYRDLGCGRREKVS